MYERVVRQLTGNNAQCVVALCPSAAWPLAARAHQGATECSDEIPPSKANAHLLSFGLLGDICSCKRNKDDTTDQAIFFMRASSHLIKAIDEIGSLGN
jgi:hypothetical protein